MAEHSSAPPSEDLKSPVHRFALSDRWMARTTGWLYISGAITAFLWVLLSDRGDPGLDTVATMAALALVLGLTMACGAADRAPRVILHVIIMVIQVVISIGYASTEIPNSSTGLFYVWTTTYAWLLFSRRAALAQTLWTATCVAVALWTMGPGLFLGLREWMMIMAASVTLGVLVGIVADRMRRGQSRLSHEATHDPLTGLPNRAYFARAVRAATAQHGADDDLTYVLLVGVDHFKLVNDSYGHRTGDEVLQVLATRLATAVGPHDVVARVGGDEFGIVCRARADRRPGPSALLGRLAEVWAQPITVNSGSITVGATTGVASACGVGGAAELMRRADVALYHGKGAGRGSVVFFDESLSVMVSRRNELGQAMQQALVRGEMAVHYQPIVDLGDRRILGAEALLRWQTGALGPITPEEFIPVAEETGLIVPIGEWVLGEVATQLAVWRRDGVVDEEFTLSVNVSVRQLTSDFIARVLRTLAEHDLPLRVIVLEVTESVLLDDWRRSGQVLADLHRSGLHLSLDDFGTGYSSITYLQQLPLQVMKIDRSFVTDLPASTTNVTLVTAIIAMGASLGIAVVAEGVECEEQAQTLLALGARRAQGFLFGRAVSAAEFAQQWPQSVGRLT